MSAEPTGRLIGSSSTTRSPSKWAFRLTIGIQRSLSYRADSGKAYHEPIMRVDRSLVLIANLKGDFSISQSPNIRQINGHPAA